MTSWLALGTMEGGHPLQPYSERTRSSTALGTQAWSKTATEMAMDDASLADGDGNGDDGDDDDCDEQTKLENDADDGDGDDGDDDDGDGNCENCSN